MPIEPENFWATRPSCTGRKRKSRVQTAFISIFDPQHEEERGTADEDTRKQVERTVGKVVDEVRRARPLISTPGRPGRRKPFTSGAGAQRVSRVGRFFITVRSEDRAQHHGALSRPGACEEWKIAGAITVGILNETISRKSRDKASPLLAGAVSSDSCQYTLSGAVLCAPQSHPCR